MAIKRQYPWIGINKENKIIVFTGVSEHDCPIVLYDPSHVFKIGEASVVQEEECRRFKGTITIECT